MGIDINHKWNENVGPPLAPEYLTVSMNEMYTQGFGWAKGFSVHFQDKDCKSRQTSTKEWFVFPFVHGNYEFNENKIK